MEYDKSWNLKGKVILVTVGAAGIGAGLVKGLLTQGASHVAFVDILQREGESLEVQLRNNFGALKAKFIKCDISNDEELTRTFKQVLDKYGRLDAVINNAAVIRVEHGFHKKTVDVNLVSTNIKSATINSTIKALELMRVDKGGTGGIVLNMSSVQALRQKTPAIYTATKFAVLQFSYQTAIEQSYEKTGVRIVTACMGPTDTALVYSHCSMDQNTASEVSERQRVTSAVAGVMAVITSASNGSTWIIARDKPPVDITKNVKEGFQIISSATDFV